MIVPAHRACMDCLDCMYEFVFLTNVLYRFIPSLGPVALSMAQVIHKYSVQRH